MDYAVTYKPDNPRVSKPDRGFTGNNAVTTESFVTNTSVSHQRNKCSEVIRLCVLCNGDHFNDCCTQYNNVSDRKQQLQRQGRCFICLRIGHTFLRNVQVLHQKHVIIVKGLVTIIKAFVLHRWINQ